MDNLVLLLILGSAIWVLIDAKSIGVRKGLITGLGNMGPWAWFFVTLLLWIVGFPMYLYSRGKFKTALIGGRSASTPTYINTPIDVLATTLFGLMAPLALKVALADGRVSPKERKCIRDYFIKQWGYDAKFVKAALALIEPRLDELEISDVAEELAKYKKSNPDCNYDVMASDLLSFLKEVMESDATIDEREELVLGEVRSVFDEAGRPWVSNVLVNAKRATAGRLNRKTASPIKREPPLCQVGLDGKRRCRSSGLIWV